MDDSPCAVNAIDDEIELKEHFYDIGDNREVLKLKLRHGGEMELFKIENLCRKLKQINITSLFCYSIKGLARCLASYGEQLEYTIEFMEQKELELVVLQ